MVSLASSLNLTNIEYLAYTGVTSTKDQIIKYTIFAVTTIVTIGAMWYISKRMLAVKPDVIHARRKARCARSSDMCTCLY